MRRHRIGLLVSVLLLAGAGITGYTLARGEPRLRAEPEASEAVAAEGGNVRIAENATVRWEYEYEMCGHTVVTGAPADEDMTGLTFTQLKAHYPEARIVSFDSDEVVLRCSFACYCPEHYILKASGGELAIYRTAAGTDKQRVFRLIHISFSEIEAGERAVLSVGRVFDSVRDAETYILEILGEGTS